MCGERPGSPDRIMKTVAVIASCDTKYKEVSYIRQCLEQAGNRALVVDMSIGPGNPSGADVSREEVLRDIGLEWDAVRDFSKGRLMELMTQAVRAAILRLYGEGRMDGLLSAGGVQNTTVATASMRALPIGFPKVMATTVASGRKPFEDVVGDKDIVVIPSVSDFTGLNSMTRTILANACACVSGMVQYAGGILKREKRPVVGITLMGITNTGACAAVEELDRLGIEAIGFHSTGVGGRVMEQLALDGVLDGILDLTTHEITSEYFGGGFSYGAFDRLAEPARRGIPMVVSTGGLDFVDFVKTEFPPRMDQRVYNMHNATLAHIKILPDEAEQVGRIFAQRLNLAVEGVTLLIPTDGMRKNTRPGENLYCKETDDALIRAITEHVNENVRVSFIEGNLNDAQWGRKAARVMADELARRGKPGARPAAGEEN